MDNRARTAGLLAVAAVALGSGAIFLVFDEAGIEPTAATSRAARPSERAALLDEYLAYAREAQKEMRWATATATPLGAAVRDLAETDLQAAAELVIESAEPDAGPRSPLQSLLADEWARRDPQGLLLSATAPPYLDPDLLLAYESDTERQKGFLFVVMEVAKKDAAGTRALIDEFALDPSTRRQAEETLAAATGRRVFSSSFTLGR